MLRSTGPSLRSTQGVSLNSFCGLKFWLIAIADAPAGLASSTISGVAAASTRALTRPASDRLA